MLLFRRYCVFAQLQQIKPPAWSFWWHSMDFSQAHLCHCPLPLSLIYLLIIGRRLGWDWARCLESTRLQCLSVWHFLESANLITRREWEELLTYCKRHSGRRCCFGWIWLYVSLDICWRPPCCVRCGHDCEQEILSRVEFDDKSVTVEERKKMLHFH